MKKVVVTIVFALFSLAVYSQENSVTLSGGYSSANVEDTDTNSTGWRVNGLFEFNPGLGKWAHGFSVGYISLSSEDTEGINDTQYKIGSWPIYYAPKFLFGKEKFKGFIKGAIGMQFSHLERSGSLGSLSDNDLGLAAGGGVGLSFMLNDKIFLSGEYELLWVSNSFYKDGLVNTAALGIGFRF